MTTKEKDADTATDTRLPDEQAVCVRHYEISESEDAGTPEDNWLRAEQELRATIDEAT